MSARMLLYKQVGAVGGEIYVDLTGAAGAVVAVAAASGGQRGHEAVGAPLRERSEHFTRYTYQGLTK